MLDAFQTRLTTEIGHEAIVEKSTLFKISHLSFKRFEFIKSAKLTVTLIPSFFLKFFRTKHKKLGHKHDKIPHQYPSSVKSNELN